MINWRISIIVSFLGSMLFSVSAIMEQEIAEYHRAGDPVVDAT